MRSFASHYQLAAFDHGGVLVNVQTGDFYALNGSATVICDVLTRSDDIQAIEDEIASRLRVPPSEARTLVRQIEEGLQVPGARTEPIGPFRYLANHEGYELSQGGNRILQVRDEGRSLELCVEPSSLEYPLVDYVRAVAPKLLFLQNATVLHGSSCEVDSSLTAFCGVSGAGKTTTARTLGRCGARTVTEDLLVLTDDQETLAVFVEGERRVHEWAAAAAERLSGTPARRVHCEELRHAAEGASIPLRSIWFLDSRRRGEALVNAELQPADALSRLLTSSFLGGADPLSWRRVLSSAHRVASQVRSYDTSVPRGIENLEHALRALRDSSTR